MTRTPDDVKKGLHYCMSGIDCPSDCPYHTDCIVHNDAYIVEREALAYIQQLEATVSKTEKVIAELSGKIGQLQAERDAAVEALKNGDVCEACKHFGTLMDEEPCASCSILHSNFEWRGVPKEE